MLKSVTPIIIIERKQLFKLSFPLILLFLFPVFVSAENLSSNPSRINKEISSLEKKIQSKQNKFKQENKKIFQYDEQIAQYAGDLKKLEARQEGLKKEIAKSEAKKQFIQRDLNKAQQVNSEFSKLYFMAVENNYFKVLLNLGKPEQAARNPVYFSYLQKAYANSLNDLLEQTRAQQENQQLLESRLAKLGELVEKKREKSEALTIKRQSRQAYLQDLDKEISESKSQKERLLKDQERLEKLAEKVNMINANARKTSSGMGFAKRKDGLAWPVEGKIIGRFGKSRIAGGVKWRGLLIAAQAGTSVKAVAAGKVVFADWMTGYGYVLIVDHGKNYMSLYGHNQQLFKKVGEKIKAKELIAEVGNSGRSGKPALYFEIRYKGKPVNPKKWLLARKR